MWQIRNFPSRATKSWRTKQKNRLVPKSFQVARSHSFFSMGKYVGSSARKRRFAANRALLMENAGCGG